jgi:hypothetical protein
LYLFPLQCRLLTPQFPVYGNYGASLSELV